MTALTGNLCRVSSERFEYEVTTGIHSTYIHRFHRRREPVAFVISTSPFVLLLLIIRGGDVSKNPGPADVKRQYTHRHSCTHSGKGVTARSIALSCDTCDQWTHLLCARSMTPTLYQALCNTGENPGPADVKRQYTHRHSCTHSGKGVTARSIALSCDTCDQWTHLLCARSMTPTLYQALCNTGENPGPADVKRQYTHRHSCTHSGKGVTARSIALSCDTCDQWTHLLCARSMTPTLYQALCNTGENPGPADVKRQYTHRHSCTHSGKGVTARSIALSCDTCDQWTHLLCARSMTPTLYQALCNSGENFDFLCNRCSIGNLPFADVDDILSLTPTSDVSLSLSASISEEEDNFHDLRLVRNRCRNNVIISHLNINSLRHKFHDLSDLFSDRLVDILFISEPKLDSTFTQTQFDAPGYNYFRKDRNCHGGGLLAYKI